MVTFKLGDSPAENLYKQFGQDSRVILAQVNPFTAPADRRLLVKNYLSQNLKELDQQTIATLINLHGAENPRYLKILLSELRAVNRNLFSTI